MTETHSPADEARKVLDLVAEGKLTPEQAEEMLSVLRDGGGHGSQDPGDEAFLGRSMREIEADAIRQTVDHCDGDVIKAARILRIPLHELYAKLGERPERGAGRHRDRRARGREERHRRRRDRHGRGAPGNLGHYIRDHVDAALRAHGAAAGSAEVAEHAPCRANDVGKWGEWFGAEFGKHFERFGEEFAEAFGRDFPGPATGEETDASPDRSWELPASNRLAVHVEDGDVAVTGSDDDRLHASRPGRASTTSSPDGNELLLAFEDSVELRVPVGTLLSARTGDGDVSVDVDCPEAADVRISSGDGDVRAHLPRVHLLDMRSGNGDAHAVVTSDVGGDAHIETGDGDIAFEGVGAGGITLRVYIDHG